MDESVDEHVEVVVGDEDEVAETLYAKATTMIMIHRNTSASEVRDTDTAPAVTNAAATLEAELQRFHDDDLESAPRGSKWKSLGSDAVIESFAISDRRHLVCTSRHHLTTRLKF